MAASTAWCCYDQELADPNHVAAIRRLQPGGFAMTSVGYVSAVTHTVDDGDQWSTALQLTS